MFCGRSSGSCTHSCPGRQWVFNRNTYCSFCFIIGSVDAFFSCPCALLASCHDDIHACRTAFAGQAVVHALMERVEKGSTTTLYCHGMTHVWDLVRLPIGVSDEAGEACLRLVNRLGSVLSLHADTAIDGQGCMLVLEFIPCHHEGMPLGMMIS